MVTSSISAVATDEIAHVFYVSRALVTKDEVFSIVLKSRTSNAAGGLTGGLLYTGNFFAQDIEGPASALDAKMEVISKDLRHEKVTVVCAGLRTKRRHGGWSMGYLNAPAAESLIAQLIDGTIATGKSAQLQFLLLEWIAGGV